MMPMNIANGCMKPIKGKPDEKLSISCWQL